MCPPMYYVLYSTCVTVGSKQKWESPRGIWPNTAPGTIRAERIPLVCSTYMQAHVHTLIDHACSHMEDRIAGAYMEHPIKQLHTCTKVPKYVYYCSRAIIRAIRGCTHPSDYLSTVQPHTVPSRHMAACISTALQPHSSTSRTQANVSVGDFVIMTASQGKLVQEEGLIITTTP